MSAAIIGAMATSLLLLEEEEEERRETLEKELEEKQSVDQRFFDLDNSWEDS